MYLGTNSLAGTSLLEVGSDARWGHCALSVTMVCCVSRVPGCMWERAVGLRPQQASPGPPLLLLQTHKAMMAAAVLLHAATELQAPAPSAGSALCSHVWLEHGAPSGAVLVPACFYSHTLAPALFFHWNFCLATRLAVSKLDKH